MSKLYYQKRIIDLQAQIKREQEAAKRDREMYDRNIKSCSSTAGKASYRKSKAEKAAYHKAKIERLRVEVAQARLNKAKEKN